MALWQIKFFVLPKAALNSTSDFKLFLKDSLFDDSQFWESLKLDPVFFDSIKNFLPIRKSWSNDIVLYGEQDSNLFEVFTENGIVLSVSFRINFTSKYEDILRQLIEFYIYNDLIVLDEKLDVQLLNVESIKQKIENSPQVNLFRKLSKPE